MMNKTLVFYCFLDNCTGVNVSVDWIECKGVDHIFIHRKSDQLDNNIYASRAYDVERSVQCVYDKNKAAHPSTPF